MANCIIKPGADIRQIRREMKQRGYILRTYKQPDGSCRYRLRKNTYLYRKEEEK